MKIQVCAHLCMISLPSTSAFDRYHRAARIAESIYVTESAWCGSKYTRYCNRYIYIYSFNNSKTSHERLKLLKNNESTSNLNESICVQNCTVSFQKIKYEKFLHGTSWRSWRSTITHLKKITSNSKVILIICRIYFHSFK